MGKIYNLFSTDEPSPATHSIKSANELLPLIRRFTQEAIEKTERLGMRLQYVEETSPDFKGLKSQYDEAVLEWVEKLHRIGAVAKGLWLVDFDTGEGYLCWSY